MDLPIVSRSNDVEYVRRLRDWLQEGTDKGTLDLAYCCIQKQVDFYYLVRDGEAFERWLHLGVRQRPKDCVLSC